MKTRTPLAFGGIVFTTLLTAGGTAFGQCDTTPPAGGIEQNDVGYCGSDTELDPNGGCNQATADWQDIGVLADGDNAVYGNVGAYTTTTGAEIRDLDWYSYTVPANGTLTMTFNSSNATTGVDPVDFVGFFAEFTDCSDLVVEGYLFPCGGEGEERR